MNRFHPAAVTLLAIAGLSPHLRADTVSASASLSSTVQVAGPRTGNNGTNFFNVGNNVTNSAFVSFGVLDFNVSAFNLAFPATAVSNLSLTLTESNTSSASTGTKPLGALNFYLVTDTTTSIAAGSGTTLAYQSADSPGGLGTQLGATPFLLGTGNFSNNTGSAGTGTVDAYNFTLSTDAQTYFLNQLNTANAKLRLAITAADTSGYSTWAGSTNAVASTPPPKLSFNVTLAQPSLIWVGGSGTWNATGGTDWSGGSWDSAKTAVFSSGSGTVTLGTSITAIGAAFNTGGYTVAGGGANVLTLASSAGGNTITVANAGDTATISAEIAGSTGLAKNGSGTLVLTGANSFTGNVTINTGTLAVGANSNFGNVANGIVLNGGTLKSTAAFAIGSARTLSGSGTIDSSAGALTFSGPVNASVLALAANSNVAFSGASAALTSAALASGSRLVISAPVTSAGRTTFSGDGTVELNGDNSAYTGGFSLSKGAGSTGPTVVLASANALGGSAGQTLFFNAGGLQASTALTGPNSVATGISVGGSVAFSGSDMEFTGAFGFFGNVARTLTVTNHTTISSNITGAGNAQDTLIKAGSGKLTLTVANGYSAGTQVLAGTLEAGPNAALGLGNVTVSAGALLQLDNAQSIDDGSNLFLLAGSSSFGLLDLNFNASLSEMVNSLTVNGTSLPAGVYNAGSLPNYITGTGNLLVAVPEPQVTWLLLLATAVCLVTIPSVRQCIVRRLQ